RATEAYVFGVEDRPPDDFVSVVAGTMSPVEFFDPQHIEPIMAAATERAVPATLTSSRIAHYPVTVLMPGAPSASVNSTNSASSASSVFSRVKVPIGQLLVHRTTFWSARGTVRLAPECKVKPEIPS